MLLELGLREAHKRAGHTRLLCVGRRGGALDALCAPMGVRR